MRSIAHVVLGATLAVLLAVPAEARVRTGTAHRDHLVGTRGSDRLRGRGGNDVLDGRGGADRLYGGPGADRISGSARSRVRGGPGNDRITLTYVNRRRLHVDCGRGRDRLVLLEVGDRTRQSRPKGIRRCESVAFVDDAPPPPPRFTAPPSSGWSTTGTIAFAGRAQARSTIELFDGRRSRGRTTTAANGRWAMTVTRVPDGDHRFTAKARDAGGTSAASAVLVVRVDTHAPAPPVIGSPAEGAAVDRGFVVSGTAEPNSTVEVFSGGVPHGTAAVTPGGTWSRAVSGLPDGTAVLTARAMDAAGNVSVPSAPRTVTVAPGPRAPAITSPGNESWSRTSSVAVSGIAEPGATVRVYEGVALRGAASALLDGRWSVVLGGLGDGSHTFAATATDAWGRVSAPSAPLTVRVDTQPPDTTIVSGPSGEIAGPSASFEFSAGEGSARFECRLDRPGNAPGSYEPCSSPENFSGLGDGAYTFWVRAIDVAGNVDATPASRSFSVATPTPTSGPTITAQLPATSSDCSTRYSSQEVWPDTTTSLRPPGGGYPSVYQRIDSSGLDIWRVQAVDGYDDPSTSLVSPADYTDPAGRKLTAWNFKTLDKQLSDGPSGALRELDTVKPPDALWTGTGPLGGDGSSQGTLSDQSYGQLAAYEANVVRYFRAVILQSGSGNTVTYTATSLTDTSKDFSAYAGGGFAVTATVLDANGFPDWETASITGVSNGGHTATLSGWSRAQSSMLRSVSTPAAGAAYNLASATPPITSPRMATPWPRPPSVGDVRYFELFNEPDLSNSSYPRVSPSLPAPAPTLTGVNVPGGKLVPGTTYSYRISSANIGGGLSLPGTEVSLSLPAGDNAIRIDWTATSHLGLSPFAYRIYGRTAGSERAIVVVGKDAPGGLTWTDGGGVTPSGAMPTRDGTPGFQLWRAHEYARMWNVVAPEMKAVDATIKLVGPTVSNPISLATRDVVTTAVTSGPSDGSWLSEADYVPVLMAQASPRPDAVSIHSYGYYEGTGSTEAQEWGGLAGGIADFVAQDQPVVGNTPVFLDETNIDAGFFGTAPAATNLRAETQMGSAWLADSYIQWCTRAPQVTELMQFEAFNGDVSWGLFSDASYAGSTACSPQPACRSLRASQPNLEYWVMRWMNAWLPPGSAIVPVSGVPDGYDAVAVKSGSNTVTVVVVNVQIGASDGNGVPGSLNVRLSGANVTAVRQVTIDGSTDMLNGPSVTDRGAQDTIPLAMAGYGVTIVQFRTG